MTATHDVPADRPVWDEKHLRLGVQAAGVALWSWNVDTDQLTMDDIGYELWAARRGAGVTFEDVSATHGFGSQLLTRIMSRHFAGSLDFDWERDGLIATLRLPVERLGV